jgi:hypothetical protein
MTLRIILPSKLPVEIHGKLTFHLDYVRATVRCINLSIITGLNFSQYNTVSCDSVENIVLGRIIGLKMELVTGGWRRM